MTEEDLSSCDAAPVESRSIGSAVMSGVAFMGSVIVLLGILFSPEIALGVALSFAQRH